MTILHSKRKTQLLLEFFCSNKLEHEILGLTKLIDNVDALVPMEPLKWMEVLVNMGVHLNLQIQIRHIGCHALAFPFVFSTLGFF